MRITRIVGTPSGEVKNPSRIIEKNAVIDETIIQKESDSWELNPRDIYRFAIEGKAQVVTKKTIDGERTFVENAKEVLAGKAYKGIIKFSINPSESILGLGQHEDGISNYRNCKQYLYQNNMKIPMPVFVSTDNYGVLVDANCLMIYEEKDNVITITLDAVSQIDYYIIRGESLKEVVQGIRRLTGKAAMLPLWSYGYVQSKERYRSQEELISVAGEFKKRDIPVSCLVLDWMSWEEGKWGNKRLDKARFPNFAELTESLHKSGIALMVSVWPNMNKGCEDQQEMLEAGKLYANLSTYDAFDEEARALYFKQCEREIFSGGADGWWCDSTEPFTPDWNGSEKKSDIERYEMAKNDLTKYMDARDANAYALVHGEGIYTNQRKTGSDKRVVNLTRSGYPSIQKYGTILWSGDIMATWEVFKKQIVDGLQMSSSGIPYWTLDIGAFFTGNLNCWKRFSGSTEGTQPWFWNGSYEDGVKDEKYRELYVRWLQYGCFLPIMRSHGTDTPREPWNFGDERDIYYDTIVKYIKLRYRLVPYIYGMAYRVYRDNDLFMTNLLFDYPESGEWADTEYMFGDFLVCPVTEPISAGGSNKKVYLPKNDIWFDYDTKQSYSEGIYDVTVPLDKMPLYIRGGSILPVYENISDINLYKKQIREQIDVEVYSGKDGSFTYYLDEGNGYDYLQDNYVAVKLNWKDNEQVFTINSAEGKYDYPKIWRIKLYLSDGNTRTKEVQYKGKEISVEL